MIAGLFIYGVLITICLVVAIKGNEDVAGENRGLHKRAHEADRVVSHLRAENAALKVVLAHRSEHPSATVLPFKREGK